MVHSGKEKTFSCDLCSYRAWEKREVIRHRKTIHNKDQHSISCSDCGKLYGTIRQLKNHILVTHSGKEKPFACNLCEFRAWSNANLLRHISCVHKKDQQTIACPHCPKMVGTKHHLRRHLLCHSGFKPYSCRLCSTARYKDSSNLKIHVKNIHNITDEEWKADWKRYGIFQSSERSSEIHESL